jgi:hypothetical protein
MFWKGVETHRACSSICPGGHDILVQVSQPARIWTREWYLPTQSSLWSNDLA